MLIAARRRSVHAPPLALLAAGVALSACILQSEPGQRGPKGDPGDPGNSGATTVTLDGGTVPIQELVDLVAAQQQSIAALQAQVQALAVNGTKIRATGDAQPIESDKPTILRINNEDFDTNDEFDTVSFRFSPKEDGYYAITCGGYVNVAAEDAVRYVAVNVNNANMLPTYLKSAARVTLQSSTVLHLVVGDDIGCVGFNQIAPPNTEIWSGTITVHRVW